MLKCNNKKYKNNNLFVMTTEINILRFLYFLFSEVTMRTDGLTVQDDVDDSIDIGDIHLIVTIHIGGRS